MTNIVEEIYKTLKELQELNKMSGEPYVPETQEEFDK